MGKRNEIPHEFSPVNQVQKLKARLLIAHGVEDQRAPIDHARALKKALDGNDKPYDARIEEAEGHGFFSETNKYEYYRLVSEFLNKNGVGD